MARKEGDLPGWLPFALTASFLVMLASGMKANWTLSADQKPLPPAPPTPPPERPPATVTRAGVLQDWFSDDYRV